jgi:hypothetical protein
MIDTQQYNVVMDCQYSIYVSTATRTTPYVWVSSIGRFGGTTHGFNSGYTGRTTVTRGGKDQYMEVYTKQMFKAQPNTINPSELWLQNELYNMNSYITKPAGSTDTSVYVDIYAPGENNFTITLIPTTASNY